jgi:alpha-glucosidase
MDPMINTSSGESEKDLSQEILPIEQTVGTDRYADVFYLHRPDRIQTVKSTPQSAIFYFENGMAISIAALNVHLFRVRYSLNGDFRRDFSYSIDPAFSTDTEVAFRIEESETAYLLITDQIVCSIQKEGGLLAFSTTDGIILRKDSAPFLIKRTILKGITDQKLFQWIDEQQYFLGFGDKTGHLLLNGRQLENWNTDTFGYSNETDPLYKSVPFFYSLQEGRSSGFYLDNPGRTVFDFGQAQSNQLAISADTGEMNYYFWTGADLTAIAQTYHQLTGTPELPPLWSLGFHQCRWSYYPEERVREIAREFRQRKIPCDALYLDIDYMDGYRCFTWDKNYFPNPGQMIQDLKNDGFQTVVMIDPGLKVDDEYAVYRSGLDANIYCRRTNGDLFKGPVWPQECVFPDFTSEKAREWWGDLFEELYKNQQVSGFWNDMNEPAVFKVTHMTFPDEVLHDFEGQPTTHPLAHNIYGLTMSRATFEGLKKWQPDKRPFVITRATFAGGQRYSWIWTGDNVASWEHLGIANIQCQRLSISGFSFTGSDIGGFVEVPEPELFIRWVQLGMFHPLFRIHSMGNNIDGAAEVMEEVVKEQEEINRLDQEPWSFGEEAENLVRQSIEWRYRLLPYIYTSTYQYCRHGIPMIRSLIFADHLDENLLHWQDGFLFGDQLAIYPVLHPGLQHLQVYLPAGHWCDFWTGTPPTGKTIL